MFSVNCFPIRFLSPPPWRQALQQTGRGPIRTSVVIFLCVSLNVFTRISAQPQYTDHMLCQLSGGLFVPGM